MAQVKFNARLGLSVGSTPTDVLDSSGNLLIVVPVSAGGTGTTTPALVQGTNVTITGTWPNQTINASGGGGSALTISDENTSLTTAATSMNFKGLGVVATTVGNAVTVTIPGQLGNLDGGIPSSTYDGIITVIDAGTP